MVPVREWRQRLLLEDAERRAASYSAEQARELARLAAAASSRAAIAREARDPRHDATAVWLLREALELRGRALEVVGGKGLDSLDLEATDRRNVDAVLALKDSSLLEGESRPRLDALRASLDRAEREAAAQVETRPPNVIRGIRLGRLGALALVVAFVGVECVRVWTAASNVAFHKPVTASALQFGSAPLDTLVDGDTEPHAPVVVARADSGWIAVDLAGPYDLTSIRLYNRQDHSYDDALPFWVEGSTDGEHWHELARRRDHFKDWTEKLTGSAAQWIRWVRVRCVSVCTIGLNELEVHGHASR